MPLCYDCWSINNEAPPRWQFKTVQERCDRCGSEFSHERVH